MTTKTLAIVGASLAGAKAAEAARDVGFDGRVVLIGDEAAAPYERPALSKEVLRGEQDPAATRVHPEDFYADHRIELIHGSATAIDVTAGAIHLSSGDRVRYDTAVLATGAEPRRLRVPGAELSGVHYLRTAHDALRLRQAIRAGTRVAVVGGGWIGSEVAASARQMGAAVVLVDPGAVPLQRVLGEEIGGVFRDLHADHGVELRLGTQLAELRGGTRVEAAVLADGTVEPADVVVVGIGVTPRTELAEATGLRVHDGIVVDRRLATSAHGVYAAGDVASAWHPHFRRHLRVEHWANALHQGSTAGRNAVGHRESFKRLPYFYSDQYDLGMEYVGHASASDSMVVRGDLAARKFVAFWQRHGIVTAAMSVNTWDLAEDLKALIESARPVAPSRLADAAVPLGELVGANDADLGASGSP